LDTLNKRAGKTYVQFSQARPFLVPRPPPIGSDEFWSAYHAALANKAEVGACAALPGSVTAAIAAYYASAQWSALSDGTRGARSSNEREAALHQKVGQGL
jgi:hypothetical protein